LESEWNRQLSLRLAATARVAAAEAEAIAGEVVPPVVQGRRAKLALALLWAAGERRAGHSIRAVLRSIRPPYGPTAEELAAVLEVMDGRRARAALAGEVTVEVEGPWLVLRAGSEPVGTAPAAALEIPGGITWVGFELEAIVGEERPTAFPLSPWRAVMDADRVGRLIVREPSGADVLAVPGGRQPLTEAIKAAGVDGQAASHWPVVESEGVVVWVPGVRSLPPGWIDESTRRYLWVSAQEVAWPR
jgi:hypothetical protein